MHKLCVLSILAVLSFAAHADGKNHVAIHGFDKMSCNDWVSSRDNLSARQQYVAWLRGIVTGYNFANPDDQVALGRMPNDISLASYVDRYCRGNPTISFAGAAFTLIAEARGKPAQQENAPSPSMNDTEAFEHWVKLQSLDMQSLDVDILRNIYKKESALGSK